MPQARITFEPVIQNFAATTIISVTGATSAVAVIDSHLQAPEAIAVPTQVGISI